MAASYLYYYQHAASLEDDVYLLNILASFQELQASFKEQLYLIRWVGVALYSSLILFYPSLMRVFPLTNDTLNLSK